MEIKLKFYTTFHTSVTALYLDLCAITLVSLAQDLLQVLLQCLKVFRP